MSLKLSKTVSLIKRTRPCHYPLAFTAIVSEIFELMIADDCFGWGFFLCNVSNQFNLLWIVSLN